MPSSRAAASGAHASSVEQDVETGSVALAVSKRQVLKANRRLSDRELEHFHRPPTPNSMQESRYLQSNHA